MVFEEPLECSDAVFDTFRKSYFEVKAPSSTGSRCRTRRSPCAHHTRLPLGSPRHGIGKPCWQPVPRWPMRGTPRCKDPDRTTDRTAPSEGTGTAPLRRQWKRAKPCGIFSVPSCRTRPGRNLETKPGHQFNRFGRGRLLGISPIGSDIFRPAAGGGWRRGFYADRFRATSCSSNS